MKVVFKLHERFTFISDDPVGETLSNAVIKCYLLFSIVQLASRAALSTSGTTLKFSI